jgi:hypothetical protein
MLEILAETIVIQYNIKTIIIKNTKYLNYLLMSSDVNQTNKMQRMWKIV